MRDASTRPYLSARGITALRARLSDRDLGVVRQVASLRLMSAAQLQAVHFPSSEHDNAAAATRARQRVLMRLIRERLLVSLQRRIGGLRAGSAGLIVTPGPVAPRLLRLPGPRRRAHEPGLRFVEHTLAVSQLIVDVIVAGRGDHVDLLDWQVEPQCWRVFVSHTGRRVLRPDAFLSLGVSEYELRWFCEVDRATESLPTVLAKCQRYTAYYQTGSEQARHGVFPRVAWIVPDETRAERLRQAIARARFPERLFVVITAQEAVRVLSSYND